MSSLPPASHLLLVCREDFRKPEGCVSNQRDSFVAKTVAGQWLPNPFWHALLYDLDKKKATQHREDVGQESQTEEEGMAGNCYMRIHW